MPESLVSVCIASFNQEEFISDCLTSVLTQKTNFEFEIIIGDDASTDNTQHIIRITCKNKKNCKIVLREKNLGCPFNGLDIWAKANSKYIAIVDGDDYWTDPYKLQKQVDYLEANPDVSCCATRFNEIDNGTIKKTLFPSHKNIIKHDLESVLNSNWSPIQTLTMVFRSDILKPKLHLLANKRIYAGDYTMTVLLALKGEIHVLPDNTGNKRVDSGGV